MKEMITVLITWAGFREKPLCPDPPLQHLELLLYLNITNLDEQGR